ncbi:MAG: MFS transporter [Pseudomonadota bacterium]
MISARKQDGLAEGGPRGGGGLTRLVTATGLTNVADGIALLAWAWLASLLTRDPLLIALPPIALRLPWLLFALPAGVVTDRTNRLALILSMDLLRGLGFAGAALAVWLSVPLPAPQATGVSAPGLFVVLLACAVVIGTAEVFRDTAAQTIVPAIVEAPRLERANARMVSAELIGNALIGPALGSVLIAAAIWLPLAANAVLFVLAFGLLRGLQGRFTPLPRAGRDWRAELGEGIVFLKDQPFLQVLALVTAVWNLFHQMVVIALILHVQENLELGPRAYGLILAAGAVGGVLGGLVAERGVRWIGAGRTAQWSSLSSAIGFALIAVAPNGVLLALVLVFFEFTSIFWNVVSLSYRQRVVPDAILGRVSGVYRLLSWGAMAVGLALSGVLVRAAEGLLPRELALVTPFALAAIAVMILTVAVWRPLRRGFDAPIDNAGR